MANQSTSPVGATSVDLQSAKFSPDFRRRILAPLGRALAPRLLGPSQRMRASQFAILELAPQQIVFFGDSITELGLWQEWFTGAPVLNRGIGGETTADLLRRLDSAINHPTAVFLLIGANDLSVGIPLQQIVANVRALLDEIERRAPGTPVFVQSVMPRNARYRDDLRRLNAAYRALVASAPRHIEYLDLWPALADEEGALRHNYTADNLHLTGEGYAAWVRVLRPHVERALTHAARRAEGESL